MPGYDGTGPRGMGPMTGGGRGYCAVPGTATRFGLRRGLGLGFGRGAWGGRGYGRGRGYGQGRYAYGGYYDPAVRGMPAFDDPASVADDRDALQEQLAAIEDHLAQIRARLQATDDQ